LHPISKRVGSALASKAPIIKVIPNSTVNGLGTRKLSYKGFTKMSNETVTYSLESVLKEIKDSIKEVSHKIDKIDERLTKLEIGQAKLTEKVEGMDKRLENVEGTQKNQVWTLIILLGGAIATASWHAFFSGNP
jgi:hypothetical protein